MTPVTLRPVRPEDEPFLLRLYATTRLAELAQVPWTNEQKEAFITMQFLAQRDHYHEHFPNASYDVILLDDNPIGRLYVLREPEEMRILDLSLMPQVRRQGIGTPLIEGVMQEAKASGRRLRIYLETFNPAVALFERLGFTRIQDDGMNFLMEWQPPSENDGV
jgi:ribosomal protein S18 acetylase RimI-like enzyme